MVAHSVKKMFRIVTALICIMVLAACATTNVTAPTGKSQARLEAESHLCDQKASHTITGPLSEQMYANCMVGFGNSVRMPNGTVLYPQQRAFVAPVTPPR